KTRTGMRKWLSVRMALRRWDSFMGDLGVQIFMVKGMRVWNILVSHPNHDEAVLRVGLPGFDEICTGSRSFAYPPRLRKRVGPRALRMTAVVKACLLERGHVDDEAVFHILLEHAFEGFIDLLDGDDFDVSGDVVPAAVLEHL